MDAETDSQKPKKTDRIERRRKLAAERHAAQNQPPVLPLAVKRVRVLEIQKLPLGQRSQAKPRVTKVKAPKPLKLCDRKQKRLDRKQAFVDRLIQDESFPRRIGTPPAPELLREMAEQGRRRGHYAYAAEMMNALPERSVDETLLYAEDLRQSDRPRTAIRELEGVLAKNPWQNEARLMLGQACREVDDFSGVAKALKPLVGLPGYHHKVLPEVAEALLRTGESKRAVELYEDRDISQLSLRDQHLRRLALVSTGLRSRDEALCNEGVQGSAIVWKVSEKGIMAEAPTEGARRGEMSVLRLAPYSYSAAVLLASAVYENGDHERGISMLDNLMPPEPKSRGERRESRPALMTAGEIYRDYAKLQEERAKEVGPSPIFKLLQQNRGLYYGKSQEAFGMAAEIDGANRAAELRRAEVLEEQGKFREAERARRAAGTDNRERHFKVERRPHKPSLGASCW